MKLTRGETLGRGNDPPPLGGRKIYSKGRQGRQGRQGKGIQLVPKIHLFGTR